MGTTTHKTNGARPTAAAPRPLADRVVARPLEREAMTKSGIMLPDTAAKKPMRGTVVATGEGRRNEKGALVPLDVHVGDEILLAKYAGTEFTLEGEDFLILAEIEGANHHDLQPVPAAHRARSPQDVRALS